MCTRTLRAQVTATPPADTRTVETFYLNSGTPSEDANEVLTGLRVLLDPTTRVYVMPSEDAILLRGTPAQIELAGKLIAKMNRPRKGYRLTYTISEMDAAKRVGVQHYTLEMFSGARTTLKQGSKVPVVTGSTESSGSNSATSQFTYVDVGINVDATLSQEADGVRLKSKLEQSSVAEDKAIAGVSEPVIRQTVLEGTALLQPGKAVALGSLDVPGSTRHLDVEVLLTPMP